MEEDVHCLVDLIIELTCSRGVEKPVEQPAVGAPKVPISHQSEGPSTSHPGMNRGLFAQSRDGTTSHTVHSPWVTEASGTHR